MMQQAPTMPELNQHLKFNDQRLDDIVQDRKERRTVYDQRYKDLEQKLDRNHEENQNWRNGIDEKLSFIYGGGIIGTGLVTFLLTIGVIKMNKAEKELREHPQFLTGLSEEDLSMLAHLARELKSPRQTRR